MTGVDGLGFLSAGLVLATFCMKQLVPLRALAITSNIAFILYGYWAGIERCPAGHRGPSATKLYDRRGYSPQRGLRPAPRAQ